MGEHHHHHHHRVEGDGRRRRLGAVFVLTATYMGAEVVGGFVSGSLALLADAGHMFSDAAALAPERERRESTTRARPKKKKAKKKAKKKKAKAKRKAKKGSTLEVETKGKRKSSDEVEAYTVTEDGSVVRIELDDDITRVIEDAKKIEAQVERQMRDIEELEALVELEKLEALAVLNEAGTLGQSIDVVQLEGQTTIELEEQGLEVIIEADGDAITVEVRSADGTSHETRHRKVRRKKARKRRRRARERQR